MSDDYQFSSSELPTLCEKIFGKDGYASILPNFEHRPEQEKMAFCCAQAISGSSAMLFEAGTGVGKSMAYLVPGIIAAKRMRRQLVVATNTIALQQQIMNNDLPRIRMMFSNCEALADCSDFKAVILVGKHNYLCTHRLKRALAEKRELFDTDESLELERIANWALTTRTGFVEELVPAPNPDVWSWVNADSSACSQKNCAGGECFYQNTRREIASADVVIVNHSLLFALLAAGKNAIEDGTGILFPNDILVLDEAHLIIKPASDAFGSSLSNATIRRELSRIYDPIKKRGLITRSGLAEYFDKKLVADAITECENLFSQIRKDYLLNRDTVRLSSPDWAAAAPAIATLDSVMRMLDSLAQNAQSDKLAAEIKDYRKKVSAMKNTLEESVYLSDTDAVYWLESSGAASRNVSINYAPIDVSKILRKLLFANQTPIILTSATLAVGDDMQNFASQIGAECAETFVCNSPFDYEKNMRAFLFADASSPDKDTGRIDCEKLANHIERLALSIRGGTLALFTSHTDIKRTAEFLRKSKNLKGRNIYVQGEMPRVELIKKFTQDGNALLLGADSFWTGIDVPGYALSQVIITRLPFENFKHPLTEARLERADAMGESSFMTISLPTAVIKFRQGIGRLIRNAKDRGIISILDSRVLTKSYGRNFTASIPTSYIERIDTSEIETFFKQEVDRFFSVIEF